jgi:hypothetical protein
MAAGFNSAKELSHGKLRGNASALLHTSGCCGEFLVNVKLFGAAALGTTSGGPLRLSFYACHFPRLVIIPPDFVLQVQGLRE